MLKAYLSNIFMILSTWWEYTFLFFMTIYLSKHPYGLMISSIFFAMDAIIRIFFATRVALFIQQINQRKRLLINLYVSVAKVILMIILPIIIINNYVLLIIWVAVVAFLDNSAGYLRYYIRYDYEKNKHITITRYSTMNALGRRGGIAIGSVIAFNLNNNITSITITLISFAVLGFIGAYLLNSYAIQYGSINDAMVTTQPSYKTKITTSILKSDPTYKLVLILMMLILFINLCFGGLGILFSHIVIDYKLFITAGINFITLFYIGYIISNLYGLFFPLRIEVLQINQLKNLFYISVFSISFFCIILWMCRFSNMVMHSIALPFGFIYGISLLIFNVLNMRIIKGTNQTYFAAKIDASGRFGYVIAQMLIGLALDSNISAISVILYIGICSIIIFTVYSIYQTARFHDTK